MKKLIIIGGPMGVGKTSACLELQKLLPDCVFLDGDWCWFARPFAVTEYTKRMVLDNITHLLTNFLLCPDYENVLFCWVLHDQSVIDSLLSGLPGGCSVVSISLVCGEETLIKRLQADVASGKRTPDVIPRALERLAHYSALDTAKLDNTCLSPAQTARAMLRLCQHSSI